MKKPPKNGDCNIIDIMFVIKAVYEQYALNKNEK